MATISSGMVCSRRCSAIAAAAVGAPPVPLRNVSTTLRRTLVRSVEGALGRLHLDLVELLLHLVADGLADRRRQPLQQRRLLPHGWSGSAAGFSVVGLGPGSTVAASRIASSFSLCTL